MSDDNNISTEGIIEERRKKLELLREENRAYLNNFSKNNNANEIHKSYESLSKEELEADPVEGLTVAGRIVLRRIMGNASFATIRDASGDIQIYVSKQSISEEKYNDFKTWDLGDIIGIEGKLFRTRTGELTIEASEAVLLTKAIRPMPDKFKGLADIEIKYRQRYLDLMSSQDTQKVFLDRSSIIDSIRSSLKSRNFMEVETPMMHPIPGGAVARPFITKHNALDRELFLRIAPELYLKRLLVGGFERVFEINRSFRNEGLSTRHNPEFTMLEFYEAYASLDQTITFVEDIIKDANSAIGNDTNISWGDDEIDLTSFRRISLHDSVLEFNTELNQADLNDIKKLKDFTTSKNIKIEDS